jgi:glutathione S-transferase
MSLRLITMPPSHYSEKARWALDHSGLQYVEERHAPLFHRFALKKIGAGTTVPALVTDSGTLADSQAILQYVDANAERKLFPQDPELRKQVEEFEALLSTKFGPAMPRWAYFHIIPHRALYTRLCTEGAPGKERLAFGLMAPVIGMGMKKGLKINREAHDRAVQRIGEYFEKVSEMLKDGRKYLFGDQFTAADLTFAALGCGPAGAKGYGGSTASEEEAPKEMREQVQGWKASPAGRFVQRIYDEHRR